MYLNGLLKCHLKGKTCRILANGQDIDYPEKKMVPGLYLPLYWLFSIIFKHVYWYIQQISGEHLQDQWSSGYNSPKPYGLIDEL